MGHHHPGAGDDHRSGSVLQASLLEIVKSCNLRREAFFAGFRSKTLGETLRGSALRTEQDQQRFACRLCGVLRR